MNRLSYGQGQEKWGRLHFFWTRPIVATMPHGMCLLSLGQLDVNFESQWYRIGGWPIMKSPEIANLNFLTLDLTAMSDNRRKCLLRPETQGYPLKKILWHKPANYSYQMQHMNSIILVFISMNHVFFNFVLCKIYTHIWFSFGLRDTFVRRDPFRAKNTWTAMTKNEALHGVLGSNPAGITRG